ncbi:hypothetical protein niasHT_034930 [Heterodera trifolii]|uniref:Uncharacterized protein n=1 Tax=Heterodera trifolii TaxID=157864 RepID=A0ABD2I639_9BILA
MQKLVFPLVNLYKDNCLQQMHEKLKNQQLDTWAQLQNAILNEKEAREQKVSELMSQKPNKICTKVVQKESRKSIKKQSNKQLKTDLEKESESIESGQLPSFYGTEQKMLRPKERVIDYHYFYRFDANAISCRHCPYRRPAHKRFKPTSTLKSHLKSHHLTVLEQYRISNNILKEDSGKEQKEGEGGTIKTEAKQWESSIKMES